MERFRGKAVSHHQACCMRPAFPNMQILFTLETKPELLKRYYATNRDILPAAMIHHVSLSAAMCLCGSDSYRMDETMKSLLIFASETLGVSKNEMEKMLFFVADYFDVYPQKNATAHHQQDEEPWLTALTQSDDELVRQAAAGMLGGAWDARKAKQCLLQALQRLADLFEELFKKRAVRAKVGWVQMVSEMMRPPHVLPPS
jgi:hypothetical protein